MPDLASRLRRSLISPQGPFLDRTDVLWVVVIVVTFAVWATQAFPWIGFYEINPDEGFNLAKAALVHAGYRMYADIWSDQPPVLTYALSALQHVAPWNVQAARWLILASAALLLASLYALIARLHGRRVALWSVALLMTAPMFIRLSVSVMIGLPSVALAVAAMAVAVVPRWSLAVRMVLAGGLYALSLQTKFFTFLLAPALLLAVLVGAGDSDRRGRWPALAGFLVACAAGLLVVTLAAGEAFWVQLVHPHFSPRLRGSYSVAVSASQVLVVLQSHAALAGAGLLGVLALAASMRRGWPEWLPVIWLVVPTIGLVLHTPVWSHQVLLLMVPLAWLGGLVVDRIVGGLWSAERLWRRAAAVLAGTILIAFCVQQAWLARGPEPQARAKWALHEQVLKEHMAGGWMVTDSPLDAFRAGYLVPPELAVYSHKRRVTGFLTVEQVVQAVVRWQPQQLTFRRFRPEPELVAHLNQRYLKVFEFSNFSHWVPYPARATGPEASAVRQRLDQLLDRFAATGVNGAFAGVVTQDGRSRYGEALSEPIGSASVFMRPPGSTPRVGACFLQAHRVTGEPRHRETAAHIAGAIMRAQTCQGGWLSASSLELRCGEGDAWGGESKITLDEGLTAQAIGFLMDVEATESDGPRRERLQESIRRALDFLVVKQNGHGAWPLSFDKKPYASHSTINDDLTTSHVRILLRAHAAYDVPSYRTAALRGIDFLLRAQSTRGGWAQQYDEQLRPAGARTFEPPALSSLETAYVLHTLLYARTMLDDPRLMPALERGALWLEKSAIGVNRWARFYDLRVNRPVYVDRQGVTYRSVDALPAERRNNYRWEGGFAEVISAITLVRASSQGDEALAGARQQVSLIRRLSHQREARAWIAKHAGEAQPPLADGNGLIWAKDVVQRCELLLSLLR